MSLRLGVCGISGRVGRAIIDCCNANPDVVLNGAVVSPGNPLVGGSLAALNGPQSVTIGDDVSNMLADIDVCIDFTLPDVSMCHVEACAKTNTPIVVGTTGFDEGQLAKFDEFAKVTALVLAPNMSVGVNASFALLEKAAAMLGDDFDVEIVESHHKHKVDAPSGTALKMGEVVAAALGRDLDQCAVYARVGHTGVREAGTIGFQSIRAADIVGEHTVMFAGDGERLEITHRSSSRNNYAQGALRAARWVNGKPPGRYEMRDVLSIN